MVIRYSECIFTEQTTLWLTICHEISHLFGCSYVWCYCVCWAIHCGVNLPDLLLAVLSLPLLYTVVAISSSWSLTNALSQTEEAYFTKFGGDLPCWTNLMFVFIFFFFSSQWKKFWYYRSQAFLTCDCMCAMLVIWYDEVRSPDKVCSYWKKILLYLCVTCSWITIILCDILLVPKPASAPSHSGILLLVSLWPNNTMWRQTYCLLVNIG